MVLRRILGNSFFVLLFAVAFALPVGLILIFLPFVNPSVSVAGLSGIPLFLVAVALLFIGLDVIQEEFR